MVFSSIVFLCVFLPITLLLYWLCPRRGKNLLLLTVSLLFYAWGEPRYILIMLFSTVFDYANGRLIEVFDERKAMWAKKLVLVVSLAGNLGILCFFKYTDFAIDTINQLTGSSIGLIGLALPIGISFYTFQTLSYTIDVYRGNVKAQHNLIAFGMYICMFPQLIAGPIVRYCDVEEELTCRKENPEDFFQGMCRFSIGLGKKVLLANQIGVLWNEIGALGKMPALTAWLGALAFTLQIYFDFSGYTDMAIGLGVMFGFHFPENFRYPYESASITEFWRRWHITLGTWFREYVYIPLGGNRHGKARQVCNLLVVWFLTGLWHGAGWNFILWGLFYFVLLIAEKLFWLKHKEKLSKVFWHVYTLIMIILGWVIFACDDITVLKEYMLSLFGANGWYGSMSIYYLRSYGILFLILGLASTHFPKRIYHQVMDKNSAGSKKHVALEALLAGCVLCLSILFLVGDSYNPFLYFRF